MPILAYDILYYFCTLSHLPLSALEPRPFVILAGLSPTKNENRNQRTTRYAFSVTSFISITVFSLCTTFFLVSSSPLGE